MLTPLDIRQHSFKRSLRGYEPEEVNAFLTAVANEFQQVLQQNADLKLEVERARTSISRYQETESMLHKTLAQAELSSKAVVDNARREADLVLAEADQRANEMVQKAYDERSRLDAELADLYARRMEVMAQLERFLASQLEQVQTGRSSDGQRLPRAEPPVRRQVRAVPNLPTQEPPKLAQNPTEPPAAEPETPPRAVEWNMRPSQQHPEIAFATQAPTPNAMAHAAPGAQAGPTPKPVSGIAAQANSQTENSEQLAIEALRPAAPSPDPATFLLKPRASFFDEALAGGRNRAIEELVDEL